MLCCCFCGLALVSTLLILVAPGQSYAHKVVRLQVVVVHGSVYFQITFLHDISQHCTLPTNTPTLTHLGLPAIPDPVLRPNINISLAHCYSMMSSSSGYWLVIFNLPKIKLTIFLHQAILTPRLSISFCQFLSATECPTKCKLSFSFCPLTPIECAGKHSNVSN